MLRVVLTIVGVLGCAWFVLGAREARQVDQATAALSAGPRIDQAQAARVSSLLADASFLNPDRQVTLLRGQLEDERGARGAGARILAGVTRAEPMNAAAWVLLARSATNAGTLKRAYAHIETLVPTVKSASH